MQIPLRIRNGLKNGSTLDPYFFEFIRNTNFSQQYPQSKSNKLKRKENKCQNISYVDSFKRHYTNFIDKNKLY